jgi:hypothetical protein
MRGAARWKAKLIALINKASDLEAAKAGLLLMIAGENGPGAATSQGGDDEKGAQSPEGATTSTDFLKNPESVATKIPGPKAGAVPASRPKRAAAAQSQKAGAIPASMISESTMLPTQPEYNGSTQAEEDMDACSLDSDNDGFQEVGPYRKKARIEKSPTPPGRPSQTRPKKIKPLVLEGLKEGEGDNPLLICKLLKEAKSEVVKTVKTKQGKILVFAKSEEAKEKLLATTLRSGVSLRQAKDHTKRQNNFVIILGVNPTINDEEIGKELNRSCKRIVSQQHGATWKIKVQCSTQEDKNHLLQSGISIGLSHFKVTDYTTKQAVLQCYKCQGFNHLAASCKSDQKCRKCGENHSSNECSANEDKCANCNGDHMASSYDCPQYAKETCQKDTVAITYASMVKKGGDQTDCVRLACCIARSMYATISHRLRQTISVPDLCKDVSQNVALFYKVNVRPEHILAMAFDKFAPSKPVASGSQVSN